MIGLALLFGSRLEGAWSIDLQQVLPMQALEHDGQAHMQMRPCDLCRVCIADTKWRQVVGESGVTEMHQCNSCEIWLPNEKFPIAYHYKGRPYRRWKCKPCCADEAAERRAKK